MNVITQKPEKDLVLNDVQKWKMEENKPKQISHELLKRTLYVVREIPPEITTVLTKMYIRVLAERKFRTHIRITTIFCLFLQFHYI